ncbi:MAG: hypothetical protein ACUVST_14935, partial [Anaerolineae bacterium]
AIGLGADPSAVQPVLDQVKHERQVEQEFQGYLAEVNQAAVRQAWGEAIRFLDQALALRPHRTDLQSQREHFVQFQEWSERAQGAAGEVASFNWPTALKLLDGIPDEFMDTGQLRRHIRREMERQAQLAEAQRMYDGARVMALLNDAPPDYPEREALTRWAQAEIERKERLAAAQQAYDAGQVLALLADTPPNYPRRAELRQWAEHEIQRRAEIESAWQKGEWEKALALLQETPADYPDREHRIREAEENLRQQKYLESLQQQAIAALEKKDWDQVIAVCRQGLAEGGEDALFGAWKDQAEKEQQIDRQVEQMACDAAAAEQEGDWERAVALLSEALSQRPDRDDLRNRLEEANRKSYWERVRVQAREKIAAEDWEAALTLLEDAPPDDAELTTWKEQAREELVRSLYAQAERAEQGDDWTTAWNALARLGALQVADETLLQRAERARREQEYAQALEQARQAMARSRWAKAEKQARIALSLFPDRVEAQAVLGEVTRKAKEAQSRRIKLMAAGTGAALVLTLLCGLLAWGRLTGGGPMGPLFWTATPTSTSTPTPTSTPTQTPTPTPTPTPALPVLAGTPYPRP